MAAGMPHVTATPASSTWGTRRLARASPPAWPGGATTPCGGSIPRWLADSNNVNITRAPYCHALYRGSLTHARGLSTAYGKNEAMSSSVSHTRTTPHSEVHTADGSLYRSRGDQPGAARKHPCNRRLRPAGCNSPTRAASCANHLHRRASLRHALSSDAVAH